MQFSMLVVSKALEGVVPVISFDGMFLLALRVCFISSKGSRSVPPLESSDPYFRMIQFLLEHLS